MTTEHWQRLKELFQAALDKPPAQRDDFVREACADDDELRARVAEMLRAHEGRDSLLDDSPVIDRAADIPPDGPIEQPDTTIGRYRLLSRIGEGGMGLVWLAEQTEPVRRNVALKVIKPGMDSAEVLARFEAERQALAMMDHPGIEKVFDAGMTERGRSYFVMEYIPGVALTEHCDREALSIEKRLDLFTQVCDAVQHAHQKGIIHRDLKPSNILVTRQNGRSLPRVIDFGIAKAMGASLTERTLFTEQGQMIGTPEYMSPEQSEMSGLGVDTRTDIYSLGVILYELLTGVLPFDPHTLRSKGIAEIQRIIHEEEPAKPSTRLSTLQSEPRPSGSGSSSLVEIAKHRRTDPASLCKLLRGDLDWITMKAMEKQRVRRYASASELAAEIRRHLKHEPVLAGPPGVGYRLGKFVRRHRAGVAFAAVLAVALIGGIVGTSWQAIRATQAEGEALGEAETSRQVTEFLVRLFEVSDPSEARGNTITAREILDEGADKIRRELQDQPEIQATLMDAIGRVYDNLGLYDAATPLLEAALETRRRRFGDENLAVADSLDHLGQLMHRKGDWEDAERLYREALAVLHKLGFDEHAAVATCLNDLGLLLFEGKGDYEAAESFLREALEMRRRLEDPDLSESLNCLAGLMEAKGELAEAERLLREVVTTRCEQLGDEHPLTLISMNNLANLLCKKRDFETAREMHEQVVITGRKVLGDDHPDLAISLQGLATDLQNLKEYAAAESHFSEALEVYRRSNLDDEHPRVVACLNNLAFLQMLKGELDEAEQMYRDLLPKARAAYGDEHPRLATVLASLSWILSKKEDYAGADALLLESLEIRRKTLPPDHPDIAGSLKGLGSILMADDRPEDAEPHLRELLTIRQKAPATQSWQIADAKHMLGACLTALGRYEEAESLLLESYPVIKRAFGEEQASTLGMMRRIGDLYEAWDAAEPNQGYDARAVEWRAKLPTPQPSEVPSEP